MNLLVFGAHFEIDQALVFANLCSSSLKEATKRVRGIRQHVTIHKMHEILLKPGSTEHRTEKISKFDEQPEQRTDRTARTVRTPNSPNTKNFEKIRTGRTVRTPTVRTLVDPARRDSFAEF